MISEARQAYNRSFTPEKYQQFLDWIARQYNYRPPFRIAETPVFVPQDLKNQLFEACEEIIDLLVQPNFKELSKGAVLSGQEVPNETSHTHFLQMDLFPLLSPRDLKRRKAIEDLRSKDLLK